MRRRSPRTDRIQPGQQTPYRAPRLGESLAIGLGCDRSPPGSRRSVERRGAPDEDIEDHRETQGA